MSDHDRDSDYDDDKTAVRQKPNDDKTAIRGSQPEPDTSSGSDDETVIRGDQGKDKDDSKEKKSQEQDKEKAGAQEAASKPESESGDSDDGSESATIVRGTSDEAASNESATILKEPGASNENATILREPHPTDENATILRGGAGAEATILRDGTEMGGEGEDSTVLRDGAKSGEEDNTIINQNRDDDSTVLGDRQKGDADTTYVASDGKPIESRGTSEAGRLLKNRFVLEEKVGSGGMGDVYKALDLRQQEAQERNPYIAIKILNENFARHKDAFISLQREATRTRGIPHPNIMGVYDFDREGETVFMSMELLDGKPLDDYLKDHPEGVTVEDAWGIIDGICQGLSRAHGAGIVHSDFKPGNIYYCTDKTAKVFDFGIARAVAAPGDLKADGEKTVFDAGSLGALTPTYASLEMLTGKEPTKSDDVYAVALVAYELFTGKHPYNRTPADKALERGLTPEPVPFLKRRHWRALKKGLALKTEDRWDSIDDFSEALFSEDPPILRYSAIAAVLVASLGFGGYAFLNPEQLPEEFQALQGRITADKTNLNSRLGQPNFASEDWRQEVRQSMSRLRGVTLKLEEDWPEYFQDMIDDPESSHPVEEVENYKTRVLDAYLAEIQRIREETANINVPQGDPLEQGQVVAQGAVDGLTQAQLYMSEVEQHFNFEQSRVSDEKSRLQQALQFREFQLTSINEDIKERDDRLEAQRLAEERAAEEAARIAARNTAYQEQIDELKDILRCKGDVPDQHLANLDSIINGGSITGGVKELAEGQITYNTDGLRNIYPEQFEVDRPGIVDALRGCVEQRIAVRAPDRARVVRDRFATVMGGEPQLANLAIEDLDPCSVGNLEGRGARAGSWCSDRLSVGGTGPELVVVPKIRSTLDDEPYAISRIEIKVSDYNVFCEATGCNKINAAGTLPVTNISLSQAQAYTAWLSDQTGKNYRLPTAEEWLHAARTDVDEGPDENVNCTVDSRGVRLGDRLLSTLSGRPNKWGLYNYVGNAREWALADDGDEVVALGGAHTDPKSECSVSKRVGHTGQPDPVTGFRIVRPIEDKS